MTDDLEPKEILDRMVEKFNKTVEEDEGLVDKLEDFDRDVMVRFKDDGNFHFSISGVDLSEIKEGTIEDSDITIDTDSDTLNALLEGDMKPMEAYARKKIKVDASFMDMLKIKNLF